MYSVLLVDDEPITKVAFRKMMSDFSDRFELIGTAGNGQEALRFIEAHAPDIVVTDLKMPKMDGIELIRRLSGQGFDGSILVLSNYSDYELVREALLMGAHDYMLKVNINAQTLLEQLEKSAAKLDNAHRRRMEVAEHGRMIEKSKMVMRESALKGFFAAPMDADVPPPDFATNAPLALLDICVQSTNSKKKIPTDGIAELLRSAFDLCDPDILVMRPGEILCVLPLAEITPDAAEEHALQAARQIAMYYDLGVTVFIPRRANDLMQARKSYAECASARGILFYERKTPVVRPETVRFAPMPQDWESTAVAGQIAELHLSNAPDALPSFLNGLLEECAARFVEPTEVRRFFYHVLERVYASVDDSGGKEQAFAAGDAVFEAKSAPELRELMLRLLPALLENALPSAYGSYKKEVQNAILYVRFHYSEKIALEDVAKAVNLNSSYLCRIFKKETGVSLFQHICDLRMKRAALLMRQGNTYIKDVSARVGISDQFYFTRLFKEHFGVSPTEYLNAQ